MPHVLVVEDDPALADNLACIASSLPAEVEVASTAREALDRAARLSFELTLLDIQLPDSRGTDLIPALRSRCEHGQVVLITGDASVGTAAESVGTGAFAYIVKPFNPEHLVGVARRAIQMAVDVRGRHAEAAQIRRSEVIYRRVVDHLPAATVAFDRSKRITVWNRRLEQITGFSRGEVVGTPVDGFVARQRLARLTVKDGQARIIRWEQVDVDIPDEEPWTCAIAIDPEQPAETFRQIVRAERLAAVTHLSRGLSHEIRNPLNSARLQLAALQRRLARGTTTPAEVSEAARIVDDEIERIDRMLSQFLTFVAPRTLSKERISLPALARDVVEQLEIPPGIELSIEAAHDVDPIVADRDALGEALGHLVRNAIEAMGDTGRLVIRVRSNGPQVEVDVEDTGIGFAAAAPIFDAFYSTKPKGTGLGLAIVHRVVDDHHGTVSVRTGPGLTVFTVFLPVNPDQRAT